MAGPIPAAAGAPGDAGEGENPAAGGENPIVSLVKNISDGLAMLTDLVKTSGLSPQVSDQLGQINQQFQDVVKTAMASGGGGADTGGAPQAPAGKGMVSPMGGPGGKPVR